MKFRNIVNQDDVKNNLICTADKDRLPNSYLLTGPEGSGKWVMALALAAYLNCRDAAGGDSCGVCPSCIQINKLQHQNLFIAIPTPPSKSDKEENENYWEILNGKIDEPYSLITGQRQMSIPVAAVRRMKKSLSQKVSSSGMRVIIIEQMDRMLTSSADALLKMIEEPPPRTLIIITSSRSEKLLQTVISRCREIHFSHLPEISIREYLAGKEDISEKSAAILARLSQGSLGKALYLSDPENTQDREVAKMLFKGFLLSDAAGLIAEASDLLPFKDRFRLNRVIASWQSLFRDVIVLKNGGSRDDVINIDFITEVERTAASIHITRDVLGLPEYLNTVMRDIDLNVETQTAIGALLTEIKKRLSRS
ncbi:MAG: AAA family ATPase [candidate division Zixibacteria bacterium]|nr:AAA family ATPase [candidate division Zixibacteria bacterium]